MTTSAVNGRMERGAAAVELAIIGPILASLLVGIIGLGSLHNSQQELEAAAREGARRAADGSSVASEVEEAVRNSLEDTADLEIAIDPDLAKPCEGRDGEIVTVAVSRPQDLELLFITSTSVEQEAEATFQCSE